VSASRPRSAFPANASGAQRFLTLDAFLTAGFEVVVLLNEPSAAGFECAHRYRSTITGKREYVGIYDLGGGTFDASLVKMTGRWNGVVTSEGIQRLGGDDFDEVILKLVQEGSTLLPNMDTTTRDLPDGDVTPYDPVFFPFDPELHDQDDLSHRPVGRREFGPDVEECYTVTPSGEVEVIITTRPAGLTRTFQLARHVPE
jgi:hypothetical protein